MSKESLEQIGNDYYNSLSQLVFNSRPIIESSTSIAQENIQAAAEITQAVEKRISKAIPSHKLYALYLLDSICKNIGSPYTSLFSSNIYRTFTETYSLVDDPTRVKLIKLFKTWKVANPITGHTLFEGSQINKIEKFLIKATASNTPPTNQKLPINGQNLNLQRCQTDSPDAPKELSAKLLIREVDDLQKIVNARLSGSPSYIQTDERLNLLASLKNILATQSIGINQLQMTKKQLDTLKKDELQRYDTYAREKGIQQPIKQTQQQQIPQQSVKPVIPQFTPHQLAGLMKLAQPQMYSQNIQAQNQNPINNIDPKNNAVFNFMTSLAQSQKNLINSPPPNNVNNGNGVNNFNSQNTSDNGRSNGVIPVMNVKSVDFLQNILSRGKKESTPTPSSSSGSLDNSKTNSHPNVPEIITEKNIDNILSQHDLKQHYINSHVVNINEINVIYDLKDNQCSNCSKRFYSTPEGKTAKRLHLDWHFRINKKLRTSDKKIIQNRNWFLSDDSWENFKEEDIIGSQGGEETEINVLATTTRERDEIETDSSKKYVVVPDDCINNTVVCGICRDKLLGVFDDDLGEWIWRNAISLKEKGKERIYHYTCYLETKGNRRDRSPVRN